MDVVIPLHEATANNYAELRFSLRSYDLYLNHSRIVIIGPTLPDWLMAAAKCGDVLFMCFIDSADPKFRDANIFLKVREYIEKVNRDDDFIFANDDYFLLRPWNPYPPYPHKGPLKINKDMRRLDDPYRKVISNTMNIVGNVDNLDVHAPMVMNPKIFKKVFSDRSNPDEYTKRTIDWRTPFGFLFKTLYGQHFSTYKGIDVKFNIMKDVDPAAIVDLPYFTTNDMACGENLEMLLTSLYPNKSRYEE